MSDWKECDTPEDIDAVTEEILVWDGCDCHIDYVDVCGETGHYYMANDTRPTHWMPLPEPPKENDQ